MKKLIALILICVASFSLIGCNGNKEYNQFNDIVQELKVGNQTASNTDQNLIIIGEVAMIKGFGTNEIQAIYMSDNKSVCLHLNYTVAFMSKSIFITTMSIDVQDIGNNQSIKVELSAKDREERTTLTEEDMIELLGKLTVEDIMNMLTAKGIIYTL